jgi:hypothetical protein
MVVFKDMAQIKFGDENIYRMRLQGTLNSPIIDWCGDITILAQEPDETLLVSLTIDADALRSFLDQFQELGLNVLPNDGIEHEILQDNTAGKLI